MDRETRLRFVWLGGLIAVVGLVLGFFPVTKAGVGCGSAFRSGGEAAAKDFASTLSGSGGLTHYVEACSDNLQMFRILAIVALILGIGLMLVMNPPREPRGGVDEDSPAEQPQA